MYNFVFSYIFNPSFFCILFDMLYCRVPVYTIQFNAVLSRNKVNYPIQQQYYQSNLNLVGPDDTHFQIV